MRLRKAFLCFLVIGAFLLFGLTGRADELLVGFNDPECTAGENVTVEMWARDGLSGIEIYLTYDTGMLEFLPNSSSGGVNGKIKLVESGRIQIVDYYSEGSGAFNYSLVFRALKAGTTNVNTDKDSSTVTVGRDDVTDSVTFYYSEVTIKESTSPTTPEPPTDPPQTEPPTEPTTQAPTEPPTTERPKSGENRLASLSFGEYSLTPAFDKDTYSYDLWVDSSKSGFEHGAEVKYSTVDPMAYVEYTPYLTSLPYGTTVFSVMVIAENGARQTYQVTIHRPEPATTAAPTTARPTQPPTTPEPTTPEPTTPEPTTEEPTTPEETTPEETSEEPTTEPSSTDPGETKDVVLLSETFSLKVEPIPEYITAPEGYELSEMLDADGNPFSCLVQTGVADPDHCIVYGAREETGEDGKTDVHHGFYLYDIKEQTLQRYGLMLPVPLETTTEEPTTESQTSTEETTTPAETTTEPTTPAPTTVPVTTVPPTQPSVTESIPSRQQETNGSLPGWFWAVLAALACLCAVLLALFLRTKNRLNEQLEKAETLSPEEEEAYLAMNKGAMLQTAKAANPPADPYAIDNVQVEDLDNVFETEEVPEKEN